MKIKERALALLLSMVMVLTFMPALAFAEEENEGSDGVPAVEETTDAVEEQAEEVVDSEAMTEAPKLNESAPAAAEGEADWDLWYLDGDNEFFYPWFNEEGNSFQIYAYGYNNSDITLSYEWSKDGVVLESGIVSGYNDDHEFTLELPIESAGTYGFTIKDADQNEISDTYTVYEPLMQNGLLFGEGEDNTAWVKTYWTDETGPTGNVVIPATVTLPNGRTLPITEVWGWFDNATSITIPASVRFVVSA